MATAAPRVDLTVLRAPACIDFEVVLVYHHHFVERLAFACGWDIGRCFPLQPRLEGASEPDMVGHVPATGPGQTICRDKPTANLHLKAVEQPVEFGARHQAPMMPGRVYSWQILDFV